MAEEAQQKWGYSPDLSIFQSLRVWTPWGEGFEGIFWVEYVPGDQDSAWHKGSTQEVILSEWISHQVRQTVHLREVHYYSHSHSSVCLWPALLGHPPTKCPSSLPSRRCEFQANSFFQEESAKNDPELVIHWPVTPPQSVWKCFGITAHSIRVLGRKATETRERDIGVLWILPSPPSSILNQDLQVQIIFPPLTEWRGCWAPGGSRAEMEKAQISDSLHKRLPGTPTIGLSLSQK